MLWIYTVLFKISQICVYIICDKKKKNHVCKIYILLNILKKCRNVHNVNKKITIQIHST